LRIFSSSSVLSRLTSFRAESQIDADDEGAPNLIVESKNEDFFKKMWLRIFPPPISSLLLQFYYGRSTVGHRIRWSKVGMKIKKSRLGIFSLSLAFLPLHLVDVAPGDH
jgi:hypothetical protein